MPFVLLFLFFALIFGPTLLAGKIVLVGDPLREFYPLRTVAWQMIRDGHLPTWLPHLLSGYPLSSMVMVGLGYPLTWPYLILPGQWAEQIYVFAPYVLAPLFTYAFLREWDRSVAASVLGALTFGYGGFLFSPIGLTGVHANSALWMPLLLLGIARSCRRPIVESFLIALGAYTMSMLAGSGQIFLYAGALALAYALFLALFPWRSADRGSARRWPPVVVAVGAIAFSAGLTAFQTFQTWATVGLSIRDAYPAERIREGSFTPALAWRSLLQPLGNFWDSSTFVPLVALLLAIVALVAAGRRNSHVWFWSIVAVLSWFLILGNHSPLFDLYVRLPFVKMFRYPARHSLEWSFAIAVLAAHGWDRVEAWLTAKNASTAEHRPEVASIVAIVVAVLAAAFFAVRWTRVTIDAGIDALGDLGLAITHLNAGYIQWKVAFTVAAIVAIVVAMRLPQWRWRSTVLAALACICCFVEPYIWMVRPVLNGWSPTREIFSRPAEATQFLLQHGAQSQRTFTLPHPYAVDFSGTRAVDAVNWTALSGFEDANGYESLILARYSLAFHGRMDTEPFVNPDPDLVGNDSHVLDLLNVGHVIAYEPFSPVRPVNIEKSGIEFSPIDLGVDVKTDRPFVVTASGEVVDSVALVTTLGGAGTVPQGARVARVSVRGADGRVVERELLAGVHTAELSYDRPGAKGTVPHAIAPIFDSGAGDPDNTYQNHRYLAKLDLGAPIAATSVEFLKTTEDAGLGIWKVSLHEARSGRWLTLPRPSPERWQRIYGRDGVVILKNRRVMPRAWLVGKVGILEQDEILRMIRGESAIPFDPRSEAYVETTSGERTITAARAFAEKGGDAPLTPADRVTLLRRDPDRLLFETTSSRAAMLVVSEIDFPGWRAKVDGKYVPVNRADYFLRGVFVPAGNHRVEMAYRPMGARKGAFVSLATVLFLGVVLRLKKVRQL